jgi:hypothetical protein
VRILVFGHVSDTGFGVVTERLAERFIGAGHDVRVIAVNHRGEPIRGALAGRVWPAAIAGQPYGGNVSSGAIDGSFWTSLDRADDWQPERVLVIADMSGLYGHLPPGGINAAWKSVPVFHYCPIEGDNLPLGWREVWKHFTPVAMSDYGARVIGEFTGQPVSRIYHGVDTEHFRPVSMNEPLRYDGYSFRTKEDAKAAFNIKPDRLIVLRTDRNVERKFYDRLFAAMVPVFDAVPQVDLMVHCRPVDEGRSLWDEIGRLHPRYHGPDHADQRPRHLARPAGRGPRRAAQRGRPVRQHDGRRGLRSHARRVARLRGAGRRHRLGGRARGRRSGRRARAAADRQLRRARPLPQLLRHGLGGARSARLREADRRPPHPPVTAACPRAGRPPPRQALLLLGRGRGLVPDPL